MEPHRYNTFNACVLLFVGGIGFYASHFNIHTALMPIGSGLLLLALNRHLKKNHRAVFYLVAAMTAIVAIAYLWPLKRNLNQNDHMGIVRVCSIMLSCILALLVYVKYWMENIIGKPGIHEK